MSTTVVHPETVSGSGPSGRTIGMAVAGLVVAAAVGFAIANQPEATTGVETGAANPGVFAPADPKPEATTAQATVDPRLEAAGENATERELALAGVFERIAEENAAHIERASENAVEREEALSVVTAGAVPLVELPNGDVFVPEAGVVDLPSGELLIAQLRGADLPTGDFLFVDMLIAAHELEVAQAALTARMQAINETWEGTVTGAQDKQIAQWEGKIEYLEEQYQVQNGPHLGEGTGGIR